MINKTEYTQQNQLVNDISGLARDVREIKTAVQAVGADALSIQEVPGGGLILSAGPITLTPNTNAFITSTITLLSSQSSLINFTSSTFVDAFTASHHLPTGSAMTDTLRNSSQVSAWIDSFEMRQAGAGVYKYIMQIRNFDTVSHDYYVEVRAFVPKAAGTVIA